MRSMLLATTAAFALTGFAALAQSQSGSGLSGQTDSTLTAQTGSGASGADPTVTTGQSGSGSTATDPTMTTGQTGTDASMTTGQTGTGATGTDPSMTTGQTGTGATGTDPSMTTGQTGTGATGTDPSMTTGQSGTATTTTMTTAGGQDYESYSEMADGSAQVAGQYAADELIGSNVVNMEGEDIGEIADLAVGPDGQVRHALIDVSGFFDVESRNVLVDIEQLRRGEGDAADDEFVLDMSQDAIDTMPRYERTEDRWTMEPRSE